MLDKLKEEGVETPAKPYPLYQHYNASSYPFLIWIFEKFDKNKCDFNAKESVGEKPEPKKGTTESKKSEEKTIFHYLIESYAGFDR